MAEAWLMKGCRVAQVLVAPDDFAPARVHGPKWQTRPPGTGTPA